MKISTDWKDYEVLATGDGEKLERWGDIYLLRPDPQVIWKSYFDLSKYKGLHARYNRNSTGGGEWQYYKKMPDAWQVSYKDLIFSIKPMGFKHTGLFPEQAYNWDSMRQIVANENRQVTVLNLFGYTGGATVALAKQGAHVTHVDAAKNMVERAKENCSLSKVDFNNTRFIVDDCKKFVMREIKRGKKYDAILMDPPSYGRGPTGELWKIEEHLYELVELTKQIMSDNFCFYLINSYTTGLQASVIGNLLKRILKDKNGQVNSYELGLKTSEGETVLPCGNSGLWVKANE